MWTKGQRLTTVDDVANECVYCHAPTETLFVLILGPRDVYEIITTLAVS